MIKAAERFTLAALLAWRDLSLDAKVVSAVGTANWLLLFANHTTVAATRDVPLWQLFPFGADLIFLIACGILPLAYALRDHRSRAAFTPRQRAWHVRPSSRFSFWYRRSRRSCCARPESRTRTSTTAL